MFVKNRKIKNFSLLEKKNSQLFSRGGGPRAGKTASRKHNGRCKSKLSGQLELGSGNHNSKHCDCGTKEERSPPSLSRGVRGESSKGKIARAHADPESNPKLTFTQGKTQPKNRSKISEVVQATPLWLWCYRMKTTNGVATTQPNYPTTRKSAHST